MEIYNRDRRIRFSRDIGVLYLTKVNT